MELLKRFKIMDFQEMNCRDCLYAVPENMGTHKACCTCHGLPRFDFDKCFTKKVKPPE
jgi:hypothetical protein